MRIVRSALAMPGRAVVVLALLSWVGTIFAFFPRLTWLGELAVHFRVQYLAVFAAAALVLWASKRRRDALVIAAGFLINAAYVLPLILVAASASHAASAPTYRALQLNVLTENHRYASVADLLRRVRPDFAVLEEVDEPWVAALHAALAEYPYVYSWPRSDNFGIAVFSRRKMVEQRTHLWGPKQMPVLELALDLDGRKLRVFGIHPPPPTSPAGWRLRDDELRWTAKAAGQASRPLMVFGDMNTTSWAPVFGELLRGGRLLDSRAGFGIQPSWPDANVFLRIPIDHVLVSPEVAVRRRWIGPPVGSDHRPVVVDFSLAAS